MPGWIVYDLRQGEIIAEIRIPNVPADTRQVFIKHRVRGSIDFAIVSVGLACSFREKTCSSVRIVLGAVASGPYRAIKGEEILSGKELTDETIEAAAKAAVDGAVPLSRNAYKIEIAKTLVKRGLLTFTNAAI